jgi:hypothetical protein
MAGAARSVSFPATRWRSRIGVGNGLLIRGGCFGKSPLASIPLMARKAEMNGLAVLFWVATVAQADSASAAEPSAAPRMPELDWSRTPLAGTLQEPPSPDPWPDWPSASGQPRRHQGRSSGPFGTVTSQLIVRDPTIVHTQPVAGDEWRTDESWYCDVAGPLYLFGQMGAGCDPVVAQELRMNGRSGVGWKLPVLVPGAQVQLRGGQALSFTDPLRPEPVKSHPELFFEVQARCALPWNMGLEYQGSAIPGFNLLEHDRLNQDLHLAVPLGRAGLFRLGAKHQWQNGDQPKPLLDGMQLYLGLELGR